MSKTNAVNSKYYYKKSLIARIVCHSVAILALLLFFLAPCYKTKLVGFEFSFSYLNEITTVKSILFSDAQGAIDTLGAVRYAIATKTAWITLILCCLAALAFAEQLIALIKNIMSLSKIDAYVSRRNLLLQKDDKKLSALKKLPSCFFYRTTVFGVAVHWLITYLLSPLRLIPTENQNPVSYFWLHHSPNFLFWTVLVLGILGTIIPHFISACSYKKGTLILLEESIVDEESELQTETTPEDNKPQSEEEHYPEPVTVSIDEEEAEDEEEYTVSYLDEDEDTDNGLHSDAMPDDLKR